MQRQGLIYWFYKGWRGEAGNDMVCLGESLHTQHLFLLTASSVERDRKAQAFCVVMTSLTWLRRAVQGTIELAFAR